MSEDTSWELFRRCVERRPGADWSRFVALHHRQVRDLIARAAADAGLRPRGELVEELQQELYCRLLRGRASAFRGETDAAMWCYLGRMGRSLALDHRRRARSSKRRLPAVDEQDPARLAAIGVTPPRCPETSYLDEERRRLAVSRCAVAAGSATPLTARVLRLALLEGWSSREIARRHRELTANQVDRLVSRLRRHLAARGIAMPRRVPRPPAAVAA